MSRRGLLTDNTATPHTARPSRSSGDTGPGPRPDPMRDKTSPRDDVMTERGLTPNGQPSELYEQRRQFLETRTSRLGPELTQRLAPTVIEPILAIAFSTEEFDRHAFSQALQYAHWIWTTQHRLFDADTDLHPARIDHYVNVVRRDLKPKSQVSVTSTFTTLREGRRKHLRPARGLTSNPYTPAERSHLFDAAHRLTEPRYREDALTTLHLGFGAGARSIEITRLRGIHVTTDAYGTTITIPSRGRPDRTVPIYDSTADHLRPYAGREQFILNPDFKARRQAMAQARMLLADRSSAFARFNPTAARYLYITELMVLPLPAHVLNYLTGAGPGIAVPQALDVHLPPLTIHDVRVALDNARNPHNTKPSTPLSAHSTPPFTAGDKGTP